MCPLKIRGGRNLSVLEQPQQCSPGFKALNPKGRNPKKTLNPKTLKPPPNPKSCPKPTATSAHPRNATQRLVSEDLSRVGLASCTMQFQLLPILGRVSCSGFSVGFTASGFKLGFPLGFIWGSSPRLPAKTPSNLDRTHKHPCRNCTFRGKPRGTFVRPLYNPLEHYGTKPVRH